MTTAELRGSKPERHRFARLPRAPIRVVLDGIRQSYNIGALFRLCDAMRVEHLAICDHDFAPHKRRVLQAAGGAVGWVPWSTGSTVGEVEAAKGSGYQVVALEQAEGSVALDAFRPRFPLCLVLGGERAGVSAGVMRRADAVLELPMYGMSNSLNVATAAAIVLYGLTRQTLEPNLSEPQRQDGARGS